MSFDVGSMILCYFASGIGTSYDFSKHVLRVIAQRPLTSHTYTNLLSLLLVLLDSTPSLYKPFPGLRKVFGKMIYAKAILKK